MNEKIGCSIITIYYNIPFICIVAATVLGTTKPIRQLPRQRFALIASIEITIDNAQYTQQKESTFTIPPVTCKFNILFALIFVQYCSHCRDDFKPDELSLNAIDMCLFNTKGCENVHFSVEVAIDFEALCKSI